MPDSDHTRGVDERGMRETGEEEDIILKAVRRLNQAGDNGNSEAKGAEAQEQHTTRNTAQAGVTSQSRGQSFDEKNPFFRASSLDSNSSWASGLRKSRSPLGESPRRRYPAAPDSTAPLELAEEGEQKHRQSEFENYQQHAHASGSEEEEGGGGDQRYRRSALQREGCQDGDEYEEERYEQEGQRYDEEEDQGFARQQVFLKSSLNRALIEP
jgi:hypothetical protein